VANLADVIRHNAQNGHGVPAAVDSASTAPAGSAPAPGPALVWQGGAMSWVEVDAEVDAYAAGLLALGLPASGGHPARVAIALPNRPEFVAVYFGVLRAGLVAVPINPGYTPRELHQLLDDSAARVLVATGEVLAALAADPRESISLTHRYRLGRPIGPTGGDGADGAAPLDTLPVRGGAPVPSHGGGDDLAVLLYTSGTEGRPKGAMLSHRALVANHVQLAAIDPAPVGPDDVVLLAVPLFHAYGLNSGLGAVAFHGATGVLVESFDPSGSLDQIRIHGVTAVIGVPAMFVAWSMLPEPAADMVSVRIAVCGAAPLTATTSRAFTAATSKPVFIGYGLTEAAPVLTTSLASPVPKPGSIGRAIPGVDLRLVARDEDVWRSDVDVDGDDFDDDASGSPGTDPGEIVVRGANLFDGYWPDGRDGPDVDGWWATGDVAYADGDGDLFLVDRLGELILVGGFNVYPLEVEQVLATHPAVAAAAVLGVPHPYTGQTVKAYVVTSAPVGVDELVRHCERNLARFKCPSVIEFTDRLPLSPTGKVRKGELRSAGELKSAGA
jgi:long-chain acyl-CoA synthetase